MPKKRIKFDEGQWFLVPLEDGGYALGIIVRGNYRTHGGLGYFFGPKYDEIPDDSVTLDKKAEDALLIVWFGDLGIYQGEWPLLSSSRPFLRENWPIPVFRKIDVLNSEKCWKIIYDQEADISGIRRSYRMERVSAEEVKDLKDNVVYGFKALQMTLTRLIHQV